MGAALEKRKAWYLDAGNQQLHAAQLAYLCRRASLASLSELWGYQLMADWFGHDRAPVKASVGPMTAGYLNHGGWTISSTPSRIAPRGCRALKKMWEAGGTQFPILGQAQAGMDVAQVPNAI